MAQQGEGGSSTRQAIRRVCTSIDVWLQNASYGIVNHFLWKSLIVLFTGLLLLGRPCQFWFIPASGDVVMNALLLVGFSIFFIDMIFHSYLDPLYYPWCDFNCRPNKDQRSSIRQQRQRQCLPCFYQGSLDFWYDFASTICFLLEVELIIPQRFGRSAIVIPLNDAGFPVSGISIFLECCIAVDEN